jgi:glycosyltransferase involved in cell wall biosynthesis
MDSKYIVITPARNEELYIEKIILSMIKQTIKPIRWLVVSDGSTDRTDEIVRKYIPQNKWIDLIRMPEHHERQFAAKVHCFNAAFGLLKNDNYNFICNCDADISFEPGYFEFLLSKFQKSAELGVAGTPFVEENYVSYDGKFANFNHVSGACQMFRKECFSDIGGYIPIKGGGIDWVAVTSARMKGWKTQTFPDKHFIHHRKMGTGSGSFLQSRFNHGKKDYYLGGHPLWEIFRGVYQLTKPPYILAGAYMMAGYFYGMVKRIEQPLPEELMRFHRKEQLERLKSIFSNVLKFKKNKNNK